MLVGGHLDGIGTDPDGTVFPAANDNGSGPAVTLEIARVLTANRAMLKNSVIFAAFAGEEEGLVGSEFFANHSLTTPLQPDTSRFTNARMLDGGEMALSNARISRGGETFAFAVTGSNPFASRTRLSYALPRAEHVQVNVYSISGALVRSLVDRNENPGVHTVEFAMRDGGRSLAPGVYMVRITAGSYRKTLRVIGIE